MDLKFKDNNKLKLSAFTQLEYIESTGTQYIDTGFKPNQDTRIVLEFNDLNQSAAFLFGSRISSSNAEFGYINGTSSGQGARYGNQERTLAITHNVKLTLDVNKTNWTLSNGNTANFNNTTFQSTVNCLLFGFNNGGTAYCVSIRVYSCKIYDNNTLIRDFIPAKDTNGVVCLYDTVSQSFFYNQGTGDFIAGPEVPSTITGLPETILLKTTTLYHKNTPNVNGLQFLNSLLNTQETAEDVVLSRIRVDIGNVSGPLSELLQYAGMSGFNDNYEPQTKPRLVGTWTINDWYTTSQFAQAQAAFDGLTIVGDPTKVLDFTQMAVQVLDPNEDNYNPAVAIILQSKSVGTTMTDAPLGHGRWFITKTIASTTNFGYNWFYGKTTLTDTNGIVTSDTTVQYDFDEFDECQYFPGIPPLVGNYGGFYQCAKLERITIPSSVTSIPTSVYGGFRECTSLKTINLDNITSLGGNAFERCYNLELTSLPAAITTLDVCTFNYCQKLALTSLNSITELNGASYQGTFCFCTGLAATLTEIPATMTKIGSGVFRDIRFPYLHLLPTTPPTGVDGFTFNNTSKFCVGFGRILEEDLEIFEKYVQASGWSSYASKFTTWYEYAIPQCTFSNGSITISTVRNSIIYYTTDGTTPTKESTQYTTPFAWDGQGVIKILAISATGNEDPVIRDFYAQNVSNPTIAVNTTNNQVTLSCTTSGAVIHYTTDGSCPNFDSPIYSAPITLQDIVKVRCFATAQGYNDSKVVGKVCVLDDSIWGTDSNTSTFAVQCIDSTKPNYNPAVCIILDNNNNLTDKCYGGGGGYLTKTGAASITYINTWFKQKATIIDTNGIVSADTTASYDFEYFNEFQYFTSITHIYDDFNNCSKLKEIKLPNSITTIGYNGSGNIGLFYNCIALYKIELNEGLVYMYSNSLYGDGSYNGMANFNATSMFQNCNSLLSLNIPSSVKRLSIQGNAPINSINIPQNSSITEMYALAKDRTLTNGITLPATLTYIGYMCLHNCNIPYVHILSTTPPGLSVDANSRIGNTIIYVGDGSSAAHDDAILADYVAATGWSDYSSRLDTWYNYLHP